MEVPDAGIEPTWRCAWLVVEAAVVALMLAIQVGEDAANVKHAQEERAKREANKTLTPEQRAADKSEAAKAR
jgi:hypothetical protein